MISGLKAIAYGESNAEIAADFKVLIDSLPFDVQVVGEVIERNLDFAPESFMAYKGRLSLGPKMALSETYLADLMLADGTKTVTREALNEQYDGKLLIE